MIKREKKHSMEQKKLFHYRKVAFDPNIKVFNMYVWTFAYSKARRNNWIQIAADRDRFQKRINDTSEILSHILTKEHREKILYHRK